MNETRDPATVLDHAWDGSFGAAAADIADLRQLYDGTMLPGFEVATFSHAEKLQPVRVVHHGESSQPLLKRSKPFPSIRFDVQGHHFDLYDYLATNRVAGMLVLKNGEIAFEDYGFRSRWRNRLHQRWSVSPSPTDRCRLERSTQAGGSITRRIGGRCRVTRHARFALTCPRENQRPLGFGCYDRHCAIGSG